MLGTLIGTAEAGIRLSYWALSWGYYGVNYMVYGKPEDPVVKRINELEKRLAKQNQEKIEQLEKKIEIEMNHLDDKSPDFIFFWEHKSQFHLGHWLVIRDRKVLIETPDKVQALQVLLDQKGEKSLLIFNDFSDEIIYQI